MHISPELLFVSPQSTSKKRRNISSKFPQQPKRHSKELLELFLQNQPSPISENTLANLPTSTTIFWLKNVSLDKIADFFGLILKVDIGVVILEIIYSLWLCLGFSELLLSLMLCVNAFLSFALLVHLIGVVKVYKVQYEKQREIFKETICALAEIRALFIKANGIWIVVTGVIMMKTLVLHEQNSLTFINLLTSLAETITRLIPFILGMVIMAGFSQAINDIDTYQSITLSREVALKQLHKGSLKPLTDLIPPIQETYEKESCAKLNNSDHFYEELTPKRNSSGEVTIIP